MKTLDYLKKVYAGLKNTAKITLVMLLLNPGLSCTSVQNNYKPSLTIAEKRIYPTDYKIRVESNEDYDENENPALILDENQTKALSRIAVLVEGRNETEISKLCEQYDTDRNKIIDDKEYLKMAEDDAKKQIIGTNYKLFAEVNEKQPSMTFGSANAFVKCLADSFVEKLEEICKKYDFDNNKIITEDEFKEILTRELGVIRYQYVKRTQYENGEPSTGRKLVLIKNKNTEKQENKSIRSNEEVPLQILDINQIIEKIPSTDYKIKLELSKKDQELKKKSMNPHFFMRTFQYEAQNRVEAIINIKTDEELIHICKKYDTNKDKFIDNDEFVNLTKDYAEKQIPGTDYKLLAYISIRFPSMTFGLTKACVECLTDSFGENVEEICKKYDADKNKMIDEDEFGIILKEELGKSSFKYTNGKIILFDKKSN